MKNVVIFGSGGHAKVILAEILNLKKKFKFCGFIDASKKLGTIVVKIEKKNYKIIDLNNKKFNNLYGVIGIGDNYIRFKKYESLKKQFKNLRWATIISNKSTLALDVKIGLGSVILANSYIGSGTKILDHCIINT